MPGARLYKIQLALARGLDLSVIGKHCRSFKQGNDLLSVLKCGCQVKGPSTLSLMSAQGFSIYNGLPCWRSHYHHDAE